MSSFIVPEELPAKLLAPGVEAHLAWGDKIMLSFVDLGPGGVVPPHSHPHEQAGLCLEGAMEFTIGEETRTIRKGQGWMIPGGVVHAVRALEAGCRALDIFSPPREDYKQGVMGDE
jgi:quercetin dioxygenase-like cupin family protein